MITINEVQKMIEKLEASGELSMKEEKYLALAKAYQQLAAENVALKNPDNWLSLSEYGDKAAEAASGNGASEDEALRVGLIAIINRIATPATDRIVAGIKADGVDMVLDLISHTNGMLYADSVKEMLSDVSSKLREGADK